MITTKLYYERGDVKLDGYTLYLTDTDKFSPEKLGLPGYCMNYTVFQNLSDSCLRNTVPGTIPQWKSIYVFPHCPYASNDIKAHYTVKRDADAGDYNVFVPIDRWKRYKTIQCLLYWPYRKVAVGSMTDSNEKKLLEIARDIFPDMSEYELKSCVVRDEYFYIYWLNDPKELYRKALDGDFKKPLVSFKQLDITNGNNLTLEVLKLVYHTVKNRDSNYDDIVTQLEMLNQYDWRNYPGTMFILTCLLQKYYKFKRMSGRSSNYNKTVREFLNITKCECITAADMEMAQSLLYYVMGFDGTRFVTLSNLLRKLDDLRLPADIFEGIFDSIVRISPRKIEEEKQNEELE